MPSIEPRYKGYFIRLQEGASIPTDEEKRATEQTVQDIFDRLRDEAFGNADQRKQMASMFMKLMALDTAEARKFFKSLGDVLTDLSDDGKINNSSKEIKESKIQVIFEAANAKFKECGIECECETSPVPVEEPASSVALETTEVLPPGETDPATEGILETVEKEPEVVKSEVQMYEFRPSAKYKSPYSIKEETEIASEEEIPEDETVASVWKRIINKIDTKSTNDKIALYNSLAFGLLLTTQELPGAKRALILELRKFYKDKF